ncbi:hypothetical protein HPHPA14_1124 [Helicobacter pylori Hp A-14]|nr:hypothetical protein HPHPA14_1124 [Helicobacter pylori Hp A-14]
MVERSLGVEIRFLTLFKNRAKLFSIDWISLRRSFLIPF